MAIIQKVLNLDDYFNSLTSNKIILNDLNFYSIDDVSSVNNMLMTVYEDETISVIPSCSCGKLKGRYRMNKKCYSCNTYVTDPQDNIDPFLWLENLEGVPMFVNPHFWAMISGLMAKNLDCARWLADITYNPPVKLPVYLNSILEHIGGVRSYSNFVNNIDNILIYLQNHSKFKTKNLKEQIIDLRQVYAENKHAIFSKHLPIINKRLFVMENTSMGKFTNLAVADLIDLVMAWIKVTSEINLSMKKKENITASVVSKFASLYTGYYKKYVTSKSGLFRKHVYGTRSHGTFRSVITSIPGPHAYDELHIPWCVGVTVFRPMLVNKLSKIGITYKNINKMLYQAVMKYDPLIDKALQELLAESFTPGSIPVLFQRNPSLLAGSMQLLRITKIDTDVTRKTTGLSLLVCKAFNAESFYGRYNRNVIMKSG